MHCIEYAVEIKEKTKCTENQSNNIRQVANQIIYRLITLELYLYGVFACRIGA